MVRVLGTCSWFESGYPSPHTDRGIFLGRFKGFKKISFISVGYSLFLLQNLKSNVDTDNVRSDQKHGGCSTARQNAMFTDFDIHVRLCALAVSNGLKAKSREMIPKHLDIVRQS